MITGQVSADENSANAKFSTSVYESIESVPLTIAGHELVKNGDWYEFQAIPYTIVLHLNGGILVGNDFTETITHTYDDKNVPVPKREQILRQNYTFGGWYIDEACTETQAVFPTNGSLSAYRLTTYADSATHVLNLYVPSAAVRPALVFVPSPLRRAPFFRPHVFARPLRKNARRCSCRL